MSAQVRQEKVMAKYSVSMKFHYIIDTDDIERTLNEFEFPVFPYPTEEDKVIFDGNTNDYYQMNQKEANIYV